VGSDAQGDAEPGATNGSPVTSEPDRPARRGRRRAPTDPMLLRYLPRDSAVHRLWAGTKLVCAAGVGALLTFSPTWPAIAVVAGALVLTMALSRVPPSATPRLPRWFWIGLGIGAVLTLQSGVEPLAHVGGVELSLGGVTTWLRLTAVSLSVLATATLVGWTTPLSEIAPALRTLCDPLRRLRLPIEEWVRTLALGIRCLPLLIGELQVLSAVRQLRAPAPPAPTRRAATRRAVHDGQELLATALVVAIRRAQEMGDAIVARGGFGAIADNRDRPGGRDAVAVLAVLAVVALALLAG
jgi:energy-coupling factor transporter transmembrane protein EcfT